jgi:hypothetical protein
MVRGVTRVIVGLSLVSAGWVAGAQTSQPDFELVVRSKSGDTCESGRIGGWITQP